MKSITLPSTLVAALLLTCGCSDDPIDSNITPPSTPVPGGGGTPPVNPPPQPSLPPAEGSPADWIGRTFLLEVPQTNWREPRNVGSEIGPYVPYFLLSIGGTAEAPSVTLGGTYDATGATQDLCTPTWTGPLSVTQFPNATVTVPAFPAFIRVQDEAEMVYISRQITIHQLNLVNVLPVGSTPSTAGQLTATMDLDESYPLFYKPPQESGAAACNTLMEALGVPCELCAHSGATSCLTLKAVGIGAREVSVTVQEVAQPDPTACAEVVQVP